MNKTIFKRKTRAFTLIELMAIMVILSIIMLIAVPLINNVIKDAKRGAFENSSLGIKKAADNLYAQSILKEDPRPVTEIVFGPTFNNELKLSGELPDSGRLIIDNKGNITFGFSNGEYCAQKNFLSNDIKITDLELMTELCDIPALNGNVNYSIDQSIGLLTAVLPLVEGPNVEYSIDNVNYQTSNIFTGLASDTEYTYYAKFYGVGEPSKMDDMTPEVFNVSINIDSNKGTIDTTERYVFTTDELNLNISELEGYIYSGLVVSSGFATVENSTVKDVLEDTVVDVTFITKTHTVDYITDGNGTIEPSNKTVLHNESLSLGTITPNSHYEIDNYEITEGLEFGNLNTSTGELTNITGPMTLKVNFKLKEYAITLESDTGGIISPSSISVTALTNFTPTINTSTGYSYTGLELVSGTANIAGDNINNIQSDITVRAKFNINFYTVYYEPSEGASITPTYRTVQHGSDIIAPTNTINTGYEFSNYYIKAGSGLGTLNTSTGAVSNITGNMTIGINFVLKEYTVSYTSATGGSTNISSRVITHGSNAGSIIATPTSAYNFVNFTITSGAANVESINSSTGALTNVTGPVTVRANFAIKTYTITYTNLTGGSVSPTSRVVNYGTTSGTVTATPTAAYNFTGYSITSGTCAGTFNSSTGVCSNVQSNITIRANFVVKTYTVTYSGNGGTCSPTSRTVTYGSTSAAPSCSRINYDLSSFTRISGSGGTLNTSTGTVTSVTGNQTISANWIYNPPLPDNSEIRYVNNQSDPNYPDNATSCLTGGAEFTHILDKRDNNTYAVTKIGSQCWIAENLRYTTSSCLSASWTNATPFNACRVNGGTGWDKDEVSYQWGAAMNGSTTEGTQGMCPTGWHVATDSEWKTLEMTLGMSQVQADAINWRGTSEGQGLKSIDPAWGGTDIFGFNAKPPGYRSTNGPLFNIGFGGSFWTSSATADSAWLRYLYSGNSAVDRNALSQAGGRSVRCLLGA